MVIAVLMESNLTLPDDLLEVIIDKVNIYLYKFEFLYC
jgi:hypothetical protein